MTKLLRFYLLSKLVNLCVIRKIPHFIIWVKYKGIFLKKFAYSKNCLLPIVIDRAARFKKKNTASCYLNRTDFVIFLIRYAPVFSGKYD